MYTFLVMTLNSHSCPSTDDIIPPHSTLIFDAELAEIVSGKLRWYKVDGPTCRAEETVQQHDIVTLTYNGFTETKFKFDSG